MKITDKYIQLIKEVPVKIVAVSKGCSLEQILALYEVGCRDFGESRVQEALLKIEKAPKDIRWHFIGKLQKNKVRKVIGKFFLIHSVDSFDLAEKISQVSQEMNVVTSILFEVNTSGEPSKSGFKPEEVRLINLSGISLKGLMTMAPLTDNIHIIRKTFSDLRLLRDKLGLKELSMGMSSDYWIAIEEGATMLRLGSCIFH